MIYIAIILFTIFLDQYTKLLVLKYLKPLDSYPIVLNAFHLTYVENTGAAFSLFSNMQAFLIVITFVFTLILSYLLFKTPKIKANRGINFSLALIIGGAIGNLIDRLRLNYVIDFIDFRFINFAIFNFADIFVVVGSLSLLLSLMINKDFWDDQHFLSL